MADGLACDTPTTAIADVQGDGAESPLAGSIVTVGGVVTWRGPEGGFHLEEPDSDGSEYTSNALYVDDAVLADGVRAGQQWLITGRVAELGGNGDTRTALLEVTESRQCADSLPLPETIVSLNLDQRLREARESMRVSLQPPLQATDVYMLRQGVVTLSSPTALRAPTEDGPPGDTARQQARVNENRTLTVKWDGGPLGPLTVGSPVPSVTGVMGHDGRGPVLLADQPPVVSIPEIPVIEQAGPNAVRLASINLHNFFNGDGQGGGFPTERGARSPQEFSDQSARIGAALAAMQPALIVVQELENDGFDEHSAAGSLLSLLNEAVPAPWMQVNPGGDRLGPDLITVGIFYRSDLFEAVGPAATLDSLPFQGQSRQPLAQTFRHLPSGVEFLVAANHLKSKGSCPSEGQNADQDDGQACWNAARVDAAKAVSLWVFELLGSTPGSRALVMGDMNSYRHEDPIQVFRDRGFIELVEEHSELPQYSFVLWGQAGTLDYAFATPNLLGAVRQARFWHVNAAWPPQSDLPQPWLRYSDHDPLLVDLDLSQPATAD